MERPDRQPERRCLAAAVGTDQHHEDDGRDNPCGGELARPLGAHGCGKDGEHGGTKIVKVMPLVIVKDSRNPLQLFGKDVDGESKRLLVDSRYQCRLRLEESFSIQTINIVHNRLLSVF